MKNNVVVEVPLPLRHDTITLKAPCTCCGEQIVEPGAYFWQHKETYSLRHGAFGKKKGYWMLYNTTKNGVVQTGSVTVRAPYCAQHTKGLRRFNFHLLMSLAIIFTIVFAAMAYIKYSIVSVLGFTMTTLLIFLPAGIVLGLLFSDLIFRIMPKTRDYPAFMQGNGHWGLSISKVREDYKIHEIGPVRHNLLVRFLNVESAKRFLATYPTAKIVQCEKLIAE